MISIPTGLSWVHAVDVNDGSPVVLLAHRNAVGCIFIADRPGETFRLNTGDQLGSWEVYYVEPIVTPHPTPRAGWASPGIGRPIVPVSIDPTGVWVWDEMDPEGQRVPSVRPLAAGTRIYGSPDMGQKPVYVVPIT